MPASIGLIDSRKHDGSESETRWRVVWVFLMVVVPRMVQDMFLLPESW